MRIHHRLVPIGVIVLASLASAGSVGARPVEHEKFSYTFSEEVDFCPDLSVRLDETGRGTFIGNRQGAAGLIHGKLNIHVTRSFTNLETGKAYVGQHNGTERDLTVTDNGDGTLTIVILVAGSTRWYAGGPAPVLIDAGHLRFAILADHGGTPDDWSDDTFLADLGLVNGPNGRTDTFDRDFCEDLYLFTS